MDSIFMEHLRRDPVVVTGMGCVSAAGSSVPALWSAVRENRSTAQWLEMTGPGGHMLRFPGCAAAELDWAGHSHQAAARRMDAATQWALHAAWQAVCAAGITGSEVLRERAGILLGCSRGPLRKWEEAHELLRQNRRVRPTMAATTTLAAGPGALAQVLDLRGPGWLVSAACASGAYAIAQAAEQLLLGNADLMVAGGADEGLHAAVVEGLRSARVLASGDGRADQLCRPFGAGRTGLVPGNGAAVLVLERQSAALRRGAVPLAVLSGWSLLTEPAGMAGMDAAGLERTMRQALHMAGLAPGDIAYINAHGTGTLTNDREEATAIESVFGSSPPASSSTKPVTGHCLGATAAMEAILCVESLRHAAVPPAPPHVEPDPALHVQPAGAQPMPELRHVLTNAAAFWGFQASLVFSRI